MGKREVYAFRRHSGSLCLKGQPGKWVQSSNACCCAMHDAFIQHVHEGVLVSPAISGCDLFGNRGNRTYSMSLMRTQPVLHWE